MMEPVREQTCGAVWDTLCDLGWNTRYYTAMADLYRHRHRWLRFVIFAGVLIEAATLYAATMHEWVFYVGAVGGLLLLTLTIWDIVSDYAENAAIPRMTAFICDDLKRETEALWRNVEADRVPPRTLKRRSGQYPTGGLRRPSECNRKLMTD